MPLFYPYRLALLASTLMLLLSSALALLVPWLAGHFATALMLPEQAIMSSFYLLLILLVVFSLLSGLNYYAGVLLANTSEKLLMDLRRQVYSHIQKLPLLILMRQDHGHLLNIFTHDACVLIAFIVSNGVNIVPLTITFCGALLLISAIDPLIALMGAVLVPVFFLGVRLLGRKIRVNSNRLFDTYADSVDLLTENLSLVKLIKSVGGEAAELSRFQSINNKVLLLHQRGMKLQLLLAPMVQLCGAASIAILLWLSVNFSADFAEGGDKTLANIVSLLLYGMLLITPVSAIAGIYGGLQEAREAELRVVKILLAQTEAYDVGKMLDLQAAPKIEFRDVWFGYDSARPVIRGLNLTIEAGETLLITGKNGVGKSTLVSLLGRYFDPDRGHIYINEVDIQDFDLIDLRRNIGLVYQDGQLFNRTIEENIEYGSEVIENEKAQEPYQWSGSDFFEALPGGELTQLMKGGGNISGGQRQSLGLARILFSRQLMMVLDEATSMLDNEAEISVMDQIKSNLGDRTVIIVSHNLSLQHYVDRVITLSAGVVDSACGDK
ncbi:MAG: ABC transporter ATP-binding protein/permease [Pseudomonadales bacterium]|nr:ABC transporter ATP-binding protein/permease [Pseudomonadales bacterium]